MTTIRNKAPLYASKKLLSCAISTSIIAGCSSVSEVSTATQETFHSLSALSTNIRNDEPQLKGLPAEEQSVELQGNPEQDAKLSDKNPSKEPKDETQSQPAEEQNIEPQDNPEQDAELSDKNPSKEPKDETQSQPAEEQNIEPQDNPEQDTKPSDKTPSNKSEDEAQGQPAEEQSVEPQDNPQQDTKPSDKTPSNKSKDEAQGQPAEEQSVEPQENPEQDAKLSDKTPSKTSEDEAQEQPTEEQSVEPQGTPEQDTKPSDETPLKHRTFNPSLSAPILPKIDFEFTAPETYDHPLQNSERLTFMLGEDGKGYYLYGEGPITDDAFNKFIKYVDYYKEQNINLDRLMLHSPGGLVNQGLRIGEYIKKNSWSTDLDKYMKCYSSCGFIYSAGVTKRFQEGAEVGYHRPYLPSQKDTPEFIRQVYNDYQPYWNMIDGDPKLYDKFMKDFGRDKMYILTEQDIEQYMTVEKY